MTRHMPVMLQEALEALSPSDGGVFVDATFGAGGYSRAMLEAAACGVVGIDRDPSVRPMADALRKLYAGRFVFVRARFSALAEAVRLSGGHQVDGVVMDVGVSSMQLDQAGRGFSFRADGPLDMRMNGEAGLSATDALALLSAAELTEVLRLYGEERHAKRVAGAIVKAQAVAPITSTAQLAHIVADTLGPGDGRIHPATRTFQALRVLVNDELGELAAGLSAAEQVLKPGGRLVVVSFHSLEDRIVKGFMRARAGLEAQGSRHLPVVETGPEPSFRLAFSGVRAPSEGEMADNPRARSAKLRAGVRTAAPAWERDAVVGGAPEPAAQARFRAALDAGAAVVGEPS